MPKAYNTTDGPLVVNDAGGIIAGGEHGEVDAEFDGTSTALATGALIWDDAVPEADDHAPAPDEGQERVFVGSPPPRSGAGSSTDAWRAYATDNRVTAADDASREDIITALDQAGVPTESQE